MSKEKQRLIKLVYDFVSEQAAKRKRDGKHEIRISSEAGTGWMVLEDEPLGNLRSYVTEIGGTGEEIQHKHPNIHDKHLCTHCGIAFGGHKGGTDQNGRAGICPPISGWGVEKPFPKFGNRSDEAIDADLKRYWQGSKSSFSPVR